MITMFNSLVFLFIGYYLGTKRSLPSDIQQLKKELQKKLERDDIGPVKRPSAEKIYKMNNPIIAQEEEAMRETLSKELR